MKCNSADIVLANIITYSAVKAVIMLLVPAHICLVYSTLNKHVFYYNNSDLSIIII